jgi:FlaG/FlaF family flagellin (archaellin)
MSKKLMVWLGIVLLLAAVAAAAVYGAQPDSSRSSNQAASSPPAQSTTPSQEAPPASGEPITVTGKMTCLPPKNTDGVSNMSCAIGLEGNDGKKYGLNASDPALTGSVPTGQQATVTGKLTSVSDSKYDIVGTIAVETLQRQ